MSCTTEAKKNLGLSRCNELPGMPKGMIETPAGFSIPAATAADPAALVTFMQAALLAGVANRIYYWPPFSTIEPIPKDAVYEDTPLSYLPVDDGNYRWKFGISQNLCLHKAMFTHRTNSGRVFLIDRKNKMIGTELSSGDFAGLTLQLLHTEKFQFNDGSVSTKSPIVISLLDVTELDKNGFMVDASTFVNELYRIVDVELTLPVDNTATVITVDVKAECDGTGVEGLVTADFILLDDDNGAAHVFVAAPVAGVSGRYTLTGTSFEASTLNLRAASLLTVKAYESLGILAVPIP